MASFQWANDPNPLSVTQNFIVPDENKPNHANISYLDSIPVVDMNQANEVVVNAISRACEDFGFFQLINHGIPLELCSNVLDVINTFFNLPYEVKVDMISTQHREDGKLFKYHIKDQETQEKIFMWSEVFYHTWNSNNANFIPTLPKNPPNYRKVVAAYIKEVASLITKLLSLLSQALGLEADYLQTRFGEDPSCTAQANYYPPCPNPELTLGLNDHTDFNILTVLLQDQGVTGLQVLKDESWVAIDPLPGALVINVADQLQVLSNDRYKSVRHRAVTNETMKRVSFAMFVGPNKKDIISPIEELIDEGHPPLYRSYTFGEFIEEFRKQEGKKRMVKEVFKVCQ